MTPRRVLVGRRERATDEIEVLLRAAGFEPVIAPLIEIAPPADPAPLRASVTRLLAGGYDWVAFTSVPAVHAVSAIVGESARSGIVGARAPSGLAPGIRVAAVGHGTAAALTALGVEVALVPAGAGSAHALADSWPAGDGTVLLPRSDIAPPSLPDTLRAKGYAVDVVTAYRTVERPLPAEFSAELATGGFSAIVLTSGSAGRSLARHAVETSTVVIAIGEATAAAATTAGLCVRAVAAEPSATALVAELVRALDEPAAEPGAAPYPRSETLPERSTGRQE